MCLDFFRQVISRTTLCYVFRKIYRTNTGDIFSKKSWTESYKCIYFTKGGEHLWRMECNVVW